MKKEVDKSNNDVVSIPGYFIKKNDKRGARHGPSERQRMYYKAQEMLHKAGQKKHGGHSSILARWHNEYSYRDSLTRIGWTEQDIMLFDRVVLENHSYVATRAERIRNSEHWILKIESGWCSATVKSTTRLCSNEKRMQKITRRINGKDPAGIQNQSSKPTSKTKKRTSVRRN